MSSAKHTAAPGRIAIWGRAHGSRTAGQGRGRHRRDVGHRARHRAAVPARRRRGRDLRPRRGAARGGQVIAARQCRGKAAARRCLRRARQGRGRPLRRRGRAMERALRHPGQQCRPGAHVDVRGHHRRGLARGAGAEILQPDLSGARLQAAARTRATRPRSWR